MKEAPIGGAEKTGFCMTNSLIEHPQNGARTGNLASSARTISIAYVQFFVPETLWKYHGLIIVNPTFNSTV